MDDTRTAAERLVDAIANVTDEIEDANDTLEELDEDDVVELRRAAERLAAAVETLIGDSVDPPPSNTSSVH